MPHRQDPCAIHPLCAVQAHSQPAKPAGTGKKAAAAAAAPARPAWPQVQAAVIAALERVLGDETGAVSGDLVDKVSHICVECADDEGELDVEVCII